MIAVIILVFLLAAASSQIPTIKFETTPNRKKEPVLFQAKRTGSF
jgi:hypothetical protein